MEVLSRAHEENQCCSENSAPQGSCTALLGRLHVGGYGAPGCQALEALVCVIDEDPVFTLVVRLRVVTCGHWQRNRRETESLPYLSDSEALKNSTAPVYTGLLFTVPVSTLLAQISTFYSLAPVMSAHIAWNLSNRRAVYGFLCQLKQLTRSTRPSVQQSPP